MQKIYEQIANTGGWMLLRQVVMADHRQSRNFYIHRGLPRYAEVDLWIKRNRILPAVPQKTIMMRTEDPPPQKKNPAWWGLRMLSGPQEPWNTQLEKTTTEEQGSRKRDLAWFRAIQALRLGKMHYVQVSLSFVYCNVVSCLKQTDWIGAFCDHIKHVRHMSQACCRE